MKVLKTTSWEGNAAVKKLDLKGKILNDNGTDTDHLDHVVYAKALARQIEQIKTPVTIGIFSEWGSGKTFLLKHVQYMLNFEQRKEAKKQHNQNQQGPKVLNKSSISYKKFQIFLSGLFILLAIILCQSDYLSKSFSFCYVGLLIFLSHIIHIIKMIGDTKQKARSNGFCCGFSIIYALFAKLPIKREDKDTAVNVTIQKKFKLQANNEMNNFKPVSINAYSSNEDENLSCNNRIQDSKLHQRFIFVNFNAWEYSGCNVLWAGIVTNLTEKIEKEFGLLTSRLFRLINLQTISRSQEHQNALMVKIQAEKSEIEMEEFMLEFGIVENCLKFSDWKKLKSSRKDRSPPDDEETWWVVKYEKESEAKCAFKTLQQCGYSVGWNQNIEECNEGSSRWSMFWNYYKQNPKVTAGLPNLIWCIIIAAVALAISIYHFIAATDILKINHPFSNFVGIASVLSLVSGTAYTVIYSVWAIINSHGRRIVKALNDKNKNLSEELGFMNTIKQEVKAITDFIHAVEFAYNVRYKVIITIDDLDRVPLPKVRCVLESINILLSERNSPFVCLIAVDSRIAVKCFEEQTDDGFMASINGHEYLKKIVNLPFCLPKINRNNSSKYIAGLIDEADHSHDVYLGKAEKKSFDQKADYPDSSPDPQQVLQSRMFYQERKSILPEEPIDFKKFLFDCREYMYRNKFVKEYLLGNPRNIKRIFNIISITSSVICCHQDRKTTEEKWRNFANAQTTLEYNQTKEKKEKSDLQHRCLAEDVVLWVILTVQWPFRVGYLVEVMEDADQRTAAGNTNEYIEDSASLLQIYKNKVQKRIASWNKNDHFFAMDGDADILIGCLKFLQENHKLNKGDVLSLLHYTVNLDHSLRRDISIQRNKEFDKKASSKKRFASTERIGHPTDLYDEPDALQTHNSPESRVSSSEEENAFTNNSTVTRESFQTTSDEKVNQNQSLSPQTKIDLENTPAGQLLGGLANQ